MIMLSIGASGAAALLVEKYPLPFAEKAEVNLSAALYGSGNPALMDWALIAMRNAIKDSLATWLARIAMNEALGRLRRQRPGVELSSLPQGMLEAQIIQFPRAASDDPEKSMAQREIHHVVEHAIDELPEAFRLVFITRVIEGMNVEETAEILRLKPETVKTRLHRARAMLRDNVEKKIGPVVMEAFPFAGKRCERLTDAVIKRLGFA
jgi:RNA polymerase sigma-70 factor (ECF subfamily)